MLLNSHNYVTIYDYIFSLNVTGAKKCILSKWLVLNGVGEVIVLVADML